VAFSKLTFPGKSAWRAISIRWRLQQGLEQGREEGLERGALIGRVQAFQEMLAQPVTERKVLASMSGEELEKLVMTLGPLGERPLPVGRSRRERLLHASRAARRAAATR